MHPALISLPGLRIAGLSLRIAGLTCAILLISAPSALWPCGPGEPDPLRIFRPLQITEALFPDGQKDAYLSVLDRLAGTCDVPEGAARSDANLENWAGLLKSSAGINADQEALQNLIYKMPADQIQKARKNSKSLPGSIEASGQIEILNYILFAKELEPLVLPPESYWDRPEPPSGNKVEPFIQKGLKQASLQKLRNLKVRYIYQAMRLAHYSGQHDRAITILGQAGDLNSSDPLYFRIRHLQAGAHLKSGKTSQGLGMLAKMAAASPSQMSHIFLDFDRYWHKEGAYDAAFQAASSDERKALIILRFFSSPEPNLALLKQMSDLYPGDAALDYMLIREVDRLEARLEEPLYYDAKSFPRTHQGKDGIAEKDNQDSGFSFSAFFLKIWHWIVPPLEASPIADIPPEEQQYMNQLIAFFGQVAEGKKSRSPGAWKLAQAYLQMLLGKHSEAKKSLNHSLVNPAESPFVRLQQRRINLLNTSAEKRKPDEELKKLILQDYSAIGATGDPIGYGCRWADHAARLLLHRNMVSLHMQAGEEGEALLWEPDVSQIYSGTSMNTYAFSALEKAQEVIHKPAGVYEKKLVEISNVKRSTVLSRLGARRMKHGDYKEAVEALEKLSASERGGMYYSDRIQAGPFNNPFSERFAPGKSAKDYNSYTIAVRMKELHKEATSSSGERAARAYYQMGLAQFNMSHFGNWWSAVDTDWSIYYEYSEKPGDPQLKLARSYFEKAVASAKDRELIAASRFMIATIAYLDSDESGYFTSDTVSLASEQKVQFQHLAKMEDTDFYREVIRSCTYYMMYRQ
ncbi:MAG: hypothetical protein CMF59_04310 [Leptospiraceae bacterium]|nr:hypothetical protein [Leptospiraceae bacterium]